MAAAGWLNAAAIGPGNTSKFWPICIGQAHRGTHTHGGSAHAGRFKHTAYATIVVVEFDKRMMNKERASQAGGRNAPAYALRASASSPVPASFRPFRRSYPWFPQWYCVRRRMHAGMQMPTRPGCHRAAAHIRAARSSRINCIRAWNRLRWDPTSAPSQPVSCCLRIWPAPIWMPRPCTITNTCTRACLDCARMHAWLAGLVCRIYVWVCRTCQHREIDLEAVDVSLNHVAALGVKVECLVETCQRLV